MIELWIFGAIVVAIIARSKGDSGFVWFLISIVISPLLSMILILAIKQKRPNSKQRRCPECMEIVHRDAIKCKHCHANLKPESTDYGSPSPQRTKPSVKACAACGHKMMSSIKTCPNCGEDA